MTDDGLFFLYLLLNILFGSKDPANLMLEGSFGGLEVLEGDFPIILTTSVGKDCVFLEMRGKDLMNFM